VATTGLKAAFAEGKKLVIFNEWTRTLAIDSCGVIRDRVLFMLMIKPTVVRIAELCRSALGSLA
jgi:hypothetical protein